MALSILDGNQSATTLSTILSSGQHITAHTVVSLGTQAITDMRGAVSGSVVSISNLPSTQSIAGTVTANVSSQDLYGQQATTGGSFLRSALYYEDLLAGAGEFLRVHNDSGGGLPIRTASDGVVNVSGTISADLNQTNFVGANGDVLDYSVQIGYYDATAGEFRRVDSSVNPLPISGVVTANLGSALPIGTNRIGVVTIGAGTVTLGASTSQIGSVTVGNSITIGSCVTHGVTISNSSVTVNGTFYQATQPVSLNTLPALVAGTAQIGSVTASISGTVPISISSVTIGSCVTHGVTIANSVVTFYPMQGTSVSNTNFTSITASTTLVSAVANREVLTVFNEGAGNLHISPGSTCTTISYQVRLSSGDYWECPAGQLSLAHTAVFATAGTARVTQIS